MHLMGAHKIVQHVLTILVLYMARLGGCGWPRDTSPFFLL
ncbi:hypothetical protein HMPREF0742_00041 [Rothia aeria F0184]|uniref:Uncharacterized protein n=1 Tax=Rothia aeria F0184 TaxID=888019 RepID=U7V887_9MICC|nr:hypothetical protein HMPREF0742_00041 [Rothia aeria F0184]